MAWDVNHARGLLGLAAIIAIGWALSEDRKAIPWRTVIGGLVLQVVLLLALFAFSPVRRALLGLNDAVDALASATQAGTSFVFGYIGGGETPFAVVNQNVGPSFFFQILPFIIVVAAISAVLWHWKVLQWVSHLFARLFERSLGLGGAVSLATAANVFLGMVESVVIIGRYFNRLTRSELFIVMVTGLSTVAGSVMLLYALLIESVLPNAIAHLVAASLISAPAGVVLALLMVPEAPGVVPTGREEGDQEGVYRSTVDAFSSGVEEGLRLLLNIAAMIIAVLATVALVDMGLKALPDLAGAPLSIERLLGWVFAPMMWLIGVPWSEAVTAGSVMGAKITMTEIMGFIRLAQDEALLSPRTTAILIYCVCGFANLASLGIMLAGFNAIAPERRSDVAGLLFRSLLAATLANLSTGSLVAILPAAWIGLG